MKAKAEEDGVEGGGRIQLPVINSTAVKSFLHQLNEDNKQDKPRTVSALSRLIDLPLEKKHEPPSLPAKPVKVRDRNELSPKGKPASNNKNRSASEDSSAPSDTKKLTSVVENNNEPRNDGLKSRDDWWRKRAQPKAQEMRDKNLANAVAPVKTANRTLETEKNIKLPIATFGSSETMTDAKAILAAESNLAGNRNLRDSTRRTVSPARKRSFKVATHKNSQISAKSRHTAMKVTIPSSRVQALAIKFNSLEDEAHSLPTSPTDVVPTRKGLKRQPSDIKIIVGNRAGVIRSVPPAIVDEVVALSTKIQSMQSSSASVRAQGGGVKAEEKQPKVALIRKRPSFAKTRESKVKAAVQKFEQDPSVLMNMGESIKISDQHSPTKHLPASQTETVAASAPEKIGSSAHPVSAISDVPKIVYPQKDCSIFQDLSHWVEPARSKDSPEVRSRRAHNKSHLKTAKTVLTEEKKLVVVNIEDIDTAPELPSSPPPQKDDTAHVSKVVINGAVPDEVESALKTKTDMVGTPTPIVDSKAPPALPARNSICSLKDEREQGEMEESKREKGNEGKEKSHPRLQANHSFLWRAAPSLTPAPDKLSEEPSNVPAFRAVPAIVNDSDVEDVTGDQDEDMNPELYDDVVPASEAENIYDDIGIVKKRFADAEAFYETCGVSNYDDCEGEGYQFVENRATASPAAVDQQLTPEEEEEAADNIYDDVSSVRKQPTPPEDNVSITSVYEAIYLARQGGLNRLFARPSSGAPLLPPGIPGIPNGRRVGVGRHGSSCSSSTASSHSSSVGSAGNASSYCGIMNSIYGETLTDEQASAVAAALGLSLPDHGYQAGRVPLSETSDEWVDLDNTPTDQEDQDDEETIVVFHDQPRRRRPKSWSRKVRTQRTKSPIRRGEVSTDSDSENPYESLYEVPDAVEDVDSFDSDSDDGAPPHFRHHDNSQGVGDVQNGKLPEVPPRENIYGVHVMRIKEAAGKKMQKLRKNWSLRKNDISNKLNRMRRKSSVDPQGAALDPLAPPTPMEKSQSAGQLAGNKYWSFKSKFRRGQPSVLGSTFYLTDELDIGKDLSSSMAQMDCKDADSASPVSQRSDPSVSTKGSSSVTRPSSVSGLQNTHAERRNSGAMRPLSPPPPPPPVPKRNGPRKDRDKSKVVSSSWYAECGLFDSSNVQNNSDPLLKRPSKDDPFNTSLYAEAGLWDSVPPSISPCDSSQSEHDTSQLADLSDSSAGNTGSESARPLFSDEPLYQFYNASVFELARRQEFAEGDSDGYEEIVDGAVKTSRPSAMELIRPREGKHRTLWCEIPEVRESGVLDVLSTHEKKLQEAKFELITSEASYVKSLNVLEKHFMNSPEFRDETVLSKSDRRILFSNVNPVRTRSEKFLADMERCWQDSVMLLGICDIVQRHAMDNFNVYTKYCTNQIYLDRTLKKLRENDNPFSEALHRLESSPKCQSLSLHSFLMLPMQRITRLPLLMVAVLNRLGPEHDEYHSCELALAALNKVVADCNEGARKMERYEEMMLLSRQLEFPQSVKPIPIISSARWLVRSGSLTQLIWRGDDAKLTFGRKINKISVHLYLFTDILVVTKRKSEDNFSVIDHCARNLVQMTPMEGLPSPQQQQLQPPLKGGEASRHLVLLTMLQNQENKTVEMVLSCGSESDRERWLAAVSPPQSDNPDERLYEMWDCPQIRAEHTYVAQQPDELSLDVGDVVNVLRKIKDGWYEGERIRDREKGWFPANHTVEIASAHIRSKNLKQRYRLLALSGSYLQEARSKIK